MLIEQRIYHCPFCQYARILKTGEKEPKECPAHCGSNDVFEKPSERGE